MIKFSRRRCTHAEAVKMTSFLKLREHRSISFCSVFATARKRPCTSAFAYSVAFSSQKQVDHCFWHNSPPLNPVFILAWMEQKLKGQTLVLCPFRHPELTVVPLCSEEPPTVLGVAARFSFCSPFLRLFLFCRQVHTEWCFFWTSQTKKIVVNIEMKEIVTEIPFRVHVDENVSPRV